MSGSDLAPFIAAVLRDRTVDEMKNEIDGLQSKLKDQEDERLQVQITGEDGSPVYYEGSMKNGSPEQLPGGGIWTVKLDVNDVVLPLNSIAAGLEIWLGGILLQWFDPYLVVRTDDGGFDQDIIDVPQMGRIVILSKLQMETRTNCAVIEVTAGFGPMLYADYQMLPGQMSVDKLLTLSRNGTAGDLMIVELIFRQSKIRGVISIIEKLGISTAVTSTGIDVEDNDDDTNNNN
jgi:hypothetical protein